MGVALDYDDYLNKRVKIISTSKQNYHKLLHMIGTVERISSGVIGVMLDGIRNEASNYGVFWFDRDELRILEDDKMEGFKRVAIVNLLSDINNKDYAFALYEEEDKLITRENQLVVVNARSKDNRVLAVVKEIMPAEMYNEKIAITAQVVGVVNMDGYNARVAEEERIKELEKKKMAIEKELEKEINKRKSVEYYEAMAEKYSDNPKLAELVAELKELGV